MLLAIFIVSLVIGFPAGIILILKDDKKERAARFKWGVTLMVIPIILLSILMIKAYLKTP
ncbi:MAG: hypothetical protein KDD32_11615 [Bacteroidetes bacterium]|nr:hypothetical protein [Bacteroidota bacterium]